MLLQLKLQVIALWLVNMQRGSKRAPDNSLGHSGQHHIPRGAPAAGANGRPPRKDANEMSISMESSRSSLTAQQQQHNHYQPHNVSAQTDELGISRELSRDRMAISNNPFTSSGSFNFNSASFSGTNSLTSSSGGVSAFSLAQQQAAVAMGGHHYPASSVSHPSSNAMGRHRTATAMAQDIGRGSVPEGDEYEQDEFEEDEEEEVHRYDDRGGGYDYKQEEKKSADKHYSSSSGSDRGRK